MSTGTTQSSNQVGLRYAEETFGSLGVLPGSPTWNPLEPNSYGEFGAQISTVARNPISRGRQRKKGVVVDLDASAGFQSDFVQRSLYDLMQGFMFADWREKPEATPTAVTGTGYTVGASASDFSTGDLVFADGFAITGNNGLKLVTGTTGTSVQVAGLAAESSPPTDATLTRVGVEAGSGDLSVTVNGSDDPVIGSTSLDFTTLGLIPGEWVFLGGDSASNRFSDAGNTGFVRVLSVSANAIVVDRQPDNMVTDSGAGQSVRVFFGHVIKNEADDALIKCRSYQLERSLGSGGFEYVKGAVANTLEIAVTTAGKITVDLGFVGIDTEQLTAAEGQKPGARPDVPEEEAFNSSSDFSRLRLLDEDIDATLATYVTEMRLTVDNGVTPNKAISVLGAIGVSAGDFMAAGTTTAYFSDVSAVKAVRNNNDVSIDFALVKSNAGWLFDLPLVSLGDGRLNVEKDAPITIPLSMDGAEHPVFRHTMLAGSFSYLPSVATTG